MRALDFDATARFGISALELMENAGKAVARETLAFLKEKGIDPAKQGLVVCCGRGANGGDGLVAARHLKEGGARVLVFLCAPKAGGDYQDLVRDNLAAARKAGVEIKPLGADSGLPAALASCGAALDALLGTGAKGKPVGALHHAVTELARCRRPVIAVDLPTGLDADSGEPSNPCVSAALTLALGLPKRGLLAPRAKRCVGELKVLDIGYPAELIRGLLKA
jgi:NAD(P)H-hydrate epimerase